jgi:DNA-binding GntR family transcriptional regulator
MSSSLTHLRDRVYQELKHEIVTGVLAPGEWLQEAPLAERFETSKTPVREGLARLVHDDLVRVFPRVGYVVTDVTVEDAQAVLEFRQMLEVAGAERAARYITEAELEQLEALAAVTVRPNEPETYPDFLERNRRFHLLIAQASRNRYLVDALDRHYDKVDRLLHYRVELGDAEVQRFETEHQSSLAPLRERHAKRAVEALTAELHRTRDEVIAVLIARGGR